MKKTSTTYNAQEEDGQRKLQEDGRKKIESKFQHNILSVVSIIPRSHVTLTNLQSIGEGLDCLEIVILFYPSDVYQEGGLTKEAAQGK